MSWFEEALKDPRFGEGRINRVGRLKLRRVLGHNRARAAFFVTLHEKFPDQEFTSLEDVLAWLLENWTLVVKIAIFLFSIFF